MTPNIKVKVKNSVRGIPYGPSGQIGGKMNRLEKAWEAPFGDVKMPELTHGFVR